MRLKTGESLRWVLLTFSIVRVVNGVKPQAECEQSRSLRFVTVRRMESFHPPCSSRRCVRSDAYSEGGGVGGCHPTLQNQNSRTLFSQNFSPSPKTTSAFKNKTLATAAAAIIFRWTLGGRLARTCGACFPCNNSSVKVASSMNFLNQLWDMRGPGVVAGWPNASVRK